MTSRMDSIESIGRGEATDNTPTQEDIRSIVSYMEGRLHLEDLQVVPGPENDVGDNVHLVGKLLVGGKHQANVVIIVSPQSVCELIAHVEWCKHMSW
jgi:hypothetical protein